MSVFALCRNSRFVCSYDNIGCGAKIRCQFVLSLLSDQHTIANRDVAMFSFTSVVCVFFVVLLTRLIIVSCLFVFVDNVAFVENW